MIQFAFFCLALLDEYYIYEISYVVSYSSSSSLCLLIFVLLLYSRSLFGCRTIYQFYCWRFWLLWYEHSCICFWGEYVHLFYLGLYLVMESLGDRLGRVSFLRYGHTIFQNGCTTLPSNQQYPRVPFAPCPRYSEFHLPFTYGLWGSILLALPHLLSHF